jgi:hypothetical protein
MTMFAAIAQARRPRDVAYLLTASQNALAREAAVRDVKFAAALRELNAPDVSALIASHRAGGRGWL